MSHIFLGLVGLEKVFKTWNYVTGLSCIPLLGALESTAQALATVGDSSPALCCLVGPLSHSLVGNKLTISRVSALVRCWSQTGISTCHGEQAKLNFGARDNSRPVPNSLAHSLSSWTLNCWEDHLYVGKYKVQTFCAQSTRNNSWQCGSP